ncbi:MAG: exodeoxyribonuclease VII small subunit [Spirochaetaceae bacterium]|nr:exodeoxyribonuclease VII small subunit [Spirochaetaceae bacterium]
MKSFEEKLSRLETISEEMKDEELPIDKSMQMFEEGIKIAKTLQKELDKMERRVEVLVNQPDTPDERPVFELFPELDK